MKKYINILTHYLVSLIPFISKSVNTFALFSIISSGILILFVTSFKSHPEGYGDGGIWRFAVHIENQFFDWRHQNYVNNQKRKKSPHAILAAIDEKSIKEIGRFPWSRNVWADIVEKLGSLGAKVIAFDVIFSEEEVSCKGQPDQKFANSIKDFPSGSENVIVGYSKTFSPLTALNVFPDSLYGSLLNTRQEGAETFPFYFVESTTFPIPTLLESGVGTGFIDMRDDGDGVFRHYTVLSNLISPGELTEQEGQFSQLFPSFGLLAYLRYKGDNVSVKIAKDGRSAQLMTPKGVLELDAYSSTRIRYLGGRDFFTEIPLIQILKNSDYDLRLEELVKGKTVFIASTAFAAHDFRNSPMGSQMPGVFFHMNMLDMLSEGRFFKNTMDSLMVSLIIFSLGLMLLFIIHHFKKPLFDLLSIFILTGGIYLFDKVFLLPQGYEIKLFGCFICFLGIYLWNTGINFYRVSKEKQRIKGTFSHYLSPSIVNEVLAHPEKLKMGGEKKDITVFFSDVRDFTKISEKLPPTELAYCLNKYMDHMTSILFKFKGTLDKYIGDAIVGYWGAPVTLKDHPTLAVKAALAMLDALPEINESFKEKEYPKFEIGIGINTGECSVGNMGSQKVFSYTALGDHMNLGARLEGLCKVYGVQMIISQHTFQRLDSEEKKNMTFRYLDSVQVKGKEHPVKIYEVLSSLNPLKNDEHHMDIYKQAQDNFFKGHFSSSVQLLGGFLAKYPQDRPALRLIQQGRKFLENPPHEDWNGVVIMNEK